MAVTVILNILKITGIVLLCTVGLVLLLVLLVLFVPIRYNLGFARTGLDTDPPIDAKGYASWLLHILHVSAYYPDRKGYNLVVRVFGIPVYKKSFTAQDKKEIAETQIEALNDQAEKQIDIVADKMQKESESYDSESDSEWAESALTEAENKQSDTEPKVEEGTKIEDSSDDPADDTEFQGSEESSDWEQIDPDDFDRFNEADPDDATDYQTADDVSDGRNKSIFSRIVDILNKIAYTIRRTYDKIKDSLNNFENRTEAIKKDIHYYHTILTSDLFEREFEKIRKKLYKLLRQLRPRKCDIRIEAGFDDPYTTGEVLAIAGILYPVWGQYVHITGNFEEVIIRGAGKIKGRIFVFTFVKLLIWYLTDKDLKKLIRLFKKEPPKVKRKKVSEEAG